MTNNINNTSNIPDIPNTKLFEIVFTEIDSRIKHKMLVQGIDIHVAWRIVLDYYKPKNIAIAIISGKEIKGILYEISNHCLQY